MSEILEDEIIMVRDDPLNWGPAIVRRICEELLERRRAAPRPTEGDAAIAREVAHNINENFYDEFAGVGKEEDDLEIMTKHIAAALSAARADERGPFQTKIAELQKEIRSLEARVRELEGAARRFLVWASTPTGFTRKGSDKVDLLVIEDVEEFKETRRALAALVMEGEGEDGKG